MRFRDFWNDTKLLKSNIKSTIGFFIGLLIGFTLVYWEFRLDTVFNSALYAVMYFFGLFAIDLGIFYYNKRKERLERRDVIVIDKEGICGRETKANAKNLVETYGWTIDKDSDNMIYCHCRKPEKYDVNPKMCNKCYKEITR
jgi:hypothetical protein